jgi:putative Mn2+ efflux pump MntP
MLLRKEVPEVLTISVLWLSLDSLVVSLALGPLLRPPSAYVRLALAFGACDALAYLIGGSLGWHIGGEWVRQASVLLVFCYGLYVLAVAVLSLPRVVQWPVWILPILMSLDNLVFGVTNTSLRPELMQYAFLLGIVSGGMALMGIVIGRVISRWLRCSTEQLAGVGLLLACCMLLFN